MPTSSSDSSGRGGLTLTASALGLALVAWGTAVLLGVAPGGAGRADPGDVHPMPRLTPFVVEPAVTLAAKDTEWHPRRHPQAGVPVVLVVPRLGIRAPIVDIEVNDGELRPPDDPTVLGWWRDGARAGAAYGSALVTGHTVHTGGGALDDLETLRPGDRVRVRTPHGIVSYDVSAVTVYRKGRLARDAERVFSQSVPSRLVLVTCEDWNGTTYLSNAVVFAEPRRR